MTVHLELAQGIQVLIDDQDVDLVAKYTWHHAKPQRNTTYAIRWLRSPDGRWTTQRMHTLITGWALVDHRNGNGLDNRRSNLRAATSSQNQHNSLSRRGTSIYKGVSWHIGRWAAEIMVQRQKVRLGRFRDEVAAALAYDAAAREYVGEYAALNFPRPGERCALRGDR
jgi:hypothetical protein